MKSFTYFYFCPKQQVFSSICYGFTYPSLTTEKSIGQKIRMKNQIIVVGSFFSYYLCNRKQHRKSNDLIE